MKSDSQFRRNHNRSRSNRSNKTDVLLSPGLHLQLLEDGRVSPRGHFELSDFGIQISSYRPPDPVQAMQMVRGSDTTTNHETSNYQHADDFPSLFHHPDDSRFTNRNPAVDLAIPLFSHGCLCIQCVRTQEIGFSENCGAFDEIYGPGCHCMAWPFNDISGRLSLRIQQENLECETKTLDNVFVHISITVLYRVSVVRSYEAYYRVTDPLLIMRPNVMDVVRSTVPKMTLDAVFAQKQTLADEVFSRLNSVFLEFGYEISSVLVTNILPNAHVKDSMNEINACKRIKEALMHRAEAEKFKRIKEAEASAEGIVLSGIGTAKQRTAIVQGICESVDIWTSIDVRIADPDPKDAMRAVLVTQYLEMLTAVGASSLMLEHGPSAVTQLYRNLEND